jgi:3'-phosphoadenosine 5'-phosphosulfate sulfotransferase (PAPS reductase)/FAD synthetase
MLSGNALLNHLEQHQGHNKLILSFSAGKDSIALWLYLRERFEIIPYYMYYVPGLEFIERSLEYYENLFGVHIIRMPHPSIYRMLNNLVFQPPERVAQLERAQLPEVQMDDITDFIKLDWKLPQFTWTATGVRAADSPNRRATINKYGPTNIKRQQCLPIWDWNKDQIIEIMRRHGVKLPMDYKIFGRSFDGIDLRFLHPIRQHLPHDYAKILEWFPLADLELFRHEMHTKNHPSRLAEHWRQS